MFLVIYFMGFLAATQIRITRRHLKSACLFRFYKLSFKITTFTSLLDIFLQLQVSSTNIDPAVITSYYIDCIQHLGIVPKILRCDLGTENTNLAFLQPFFHHECNDDMAGRKSFMYGKSMSNQRIEAWWSILQNQCTDWWICLFKDLRDRSLYNSLDAIHNQCIKFCFLQVLQDELHRVATEWILHPIRSNNNNENPHRKPDVIYFTPELYNTHDYGTMVTNEDVAICKELYKKDKPSYYDEEFLQLVHLLRPKHNHPNYH